MSTTYRIKSVAERTGFSAATLRYYEDIGLLPPPARTAAGYRTYDDATIARLAFIARAKQLGCTLDEITALASAWDGGDCGPVQDGLRELVRAKMAASQGRIVELMTFTAELQAADAALGGHRPAGPCDDGCGCLTTPGVETAGAGGVAAGEGGGTERAVSLGRKATATVTATSGPGSAPGLPIACTLTPDRYGERLADWNALLAHVEHRGRTAAGAVRLSFAPGIDAADVARLAAAEQDCCRFFSFSLTIDERGLALEIGAPCDAGDLVDAVFGIPA